MMSRRHRAGSSEERQYYTQNDSYMQQNDRPYIERYKQQSPRHNTQSYKRKSDSSSTNNSRSRSYGSGRHTTTSYELDTRQSNTRQDMSKRSLSSSLNDRFAASSGHQSTFGRTTRQHRPGSLSERFSDSSEPTLLQELRKLRQNYEKANSSKPSSTYRIKNEVKSEPSTTIKSNVLNLPISPREIAYAHLYEESRKTKQEPESLSQMFASPRHLHDSKTFNWSSHNTGPKKTWPKPAEEKAPVTDELVEYKGILRCEICNVDFNHPIVTKAHLTGKPHHKKLKALGLPIPEICIDKCKPDWERRLAEANSPKNPVKKEPGAEDPDSQLPWPDWMQEKFHDDFCGICNVPLSSGLVADSHYLGKKHIKRCNTLYVRDKPQDNTAQPDHGTRFYCDICHIYCSSKEIMDQHLAGIKHQNACHWHRAANDAPNVSAVRERVVEVEIIESDDQKRIDEAAAEDFFANAAKMNGL